MRLSDECWLASCMWIVYKFSKEKMLVTQLKQAQCGMFTS